MQVLVRAVLEFGGIELWFDDATEKNKAPNHYTLNPKP